MELHTDKDKKMKVKRTCPLCGRSYSAPPALSRKDNVTEICPMCGILEALAAAGGPGTDKKELPKRQEA